MIGAGNVATHLGAALRQASCQIVGVYSRTYSHAAQLAQQLACNYPFDVIEQLPVADIYLFAVKDDVLPSLVKLVAQCKESAGALFIHTAGSVPLTVLSEQVGRAAVLYPMQTFSKQRAVSFAHLPLFIEASTTEALAVVRELASSLSDQVTELTSEQRKMLHLAAVFACNFSNHCYALAAELLAKEHINPDCLLSLIDETAQKVHEMPAVSAQTGPAVRWDESVMARHLELLQDNPALQQVYQVLSKSIHQLHHDSIRS